MKFLKAILILTVLWNCQLAIAESICNEVLTKDLTKPQSRFTTVLTDMERVLHSGKPINEIIEQIMDEDLRKSVFRSELLAKFYFTHPKASKNYKKYFKGLFKSFKSLEDVIGYYGKYSDLYKQAVKLGTSQELIDRLAYKKEEAYEVLKESLQKENWLENTSKGRIDKIKKILNKIKWKDSAADAIYLAETTGEFLKNIRHKITNELAPLIERESYDYEALEDGLHEFRRDIREFSILAQATGGTFQLNPPTEKYKALHWTLEKYRDSKYTKLEPGNGHSIGVSVEAFYVLSHLVSKVGKTKDMGETRHYLALELLELESTEKAMSLAEAYGVMEALMAESKPDIDFHVENSAHELFQYYLEVDPLQILIEDINVYLRGVNSFGE